MKNKEWTEEMARAYAAGLADARDGVVNQALRYLHYWHYDQGFNQGLTLYKPIRA